MQISMKTVSPAQDLKTSLYLNLITKRVKILTVNDTPRRNPGYRDTPARENNKKFNFELIN